MNRILKNEELGRLSVQAYKTAKKPPIILVLDNVRSAHNVGSVFRTADAFRVEAVYLLGITATPPHKEIRKTALGADESVCWEHFENTEQVIRKIELLKYQLISVEQTVQSEELNNFKVQENTGYALVFGNEVNGVGEQFVNASNKCLEIPQMGTKHSFNIAVSAGIVLWELAKQMGK